MIRNLVTLLFVRIDCVILQDEAPDGRIDSSDSSLEVTLRSAFDRLQGKKQEFDEWMLKWEEEPYKISAQIQKLKEEEIEEKIKKLLDSLSITENHIKDFREFLRINLKHFLQLSNDLYTIIADG